MLDITVIIPTLNRPVGLKNLVNSIIEFPETNQPNQIIIVDQSDVHIPLFVPNSYIQFKHIMLERKSLTKARNIGLQYAINDIVVYCDDDINLNNDIFIKIYNTMMGRNLSMIAGIEQNSLRKATFLSYSSLSRSYVHRKKGHVSQAVIGNYPVNLIHEAKTNFSMGGFFVVKKSLIEKTKVTWDEALVGHGYPEDLDFSYRYTKLTEKYGFLAIVSRDIEVYHEPSNEYLQQSDYQLKTFVLNRYYISSKIFKTKLSLYSVFVHNLFYSLFILLKRDKRWIGINKLNLLCFLKINELKKIGLSEFNKKYKLDKFKF